MFFQSLKMALKSIFANKMRSFLTLLGVMIGVLSVVVLVAIAQGSNASIISSIEGMGTNLLTVNIRARRSVAVITLDNLNTLAQEDSIGHVAPTVSVSGTVKAGVTTYDDASVTGTTDGYLEIRGMSLRSGRFISTPDLDNRSYVAVVGTEAATEMFGTVNVLGESFTLNGLNFTIVGVLNEVGTSSAGSGDNVIFIPFTLAQRIAGSTTISSFYVSAESSEVVSQAEAAVTDFLSRLYSSSNYYSVYNQTSMIETLSETTQTLTLMLGGIAAISLLVGGIGIMNIMLVSVSERTREIGIRKAIGASRASILTQFLIEALTVSLMGGLLGLALAIAFCLFVAPAFSIATSLSTAVGLAAIAFSVLVGVVFGLYPANKASKLRPIEALRYE